MKQFYITDLWNVISSPEEGYKALGLVLLRQVFTDLQKGNGLANRQNYMSAKRFTRTALFQSLVEYFGLEEMFQQVRTVEMM